MANRLYERQKAVSIRRVTRLARSSLFDGMVTRLARPTSLHITLWLAQPGKLGQGETIRACANAVLKNLAKVFWDGRVSEQLFFLYTGHSKTMGLVMQKKKEFLDTGSSGELRNVSLEICKGVV